MKNLKRIAVLLTATTVLTTSIPYSIFAAEELLDGYEEITVFDEENEDTFDSDIIEDTKDKENENESEEDIEVQDDNENTNSLEESSIVIEEDSVEESVGDDWFTDGTESSESNEAVSLTSEELVEMVSSAQNTEAPYSSITQEKLNALSPGSYSITANVFVPGEDNTVLTGVTAYLTNPKYPFAEDSKLSDTPTKPQYYNATLNVSEEHEITLKIELKNPVFQALKISSSEAVTVQNVTRTSDGSQFGDADVYKKYVDGYNETTQEGRIQTLTLKLNNYSGDYKFGSCTEFATLLKMFDTAGTAEESYYIWNTTLGLRVDFDSIGEQEDPNSKPTFRYNNDIGIAVSSNKKLADGITVDLKKITEGDVYDQIKAYMEKNIRKKTRLKYNVYYVGLKDNKGAAIDNLQPYALTFYSSTGDEMFEGAYGGSGFFRWENNKAVDIIRAQPSDMVNVSDMLSEGETISTTNYYKWQEDEFPGGYVVIFTASRGLGYESSFEDTTTGTKIIYRGSYGQDNGIKQSEAEILYDIKSTKNEIGFNDDTLISKIDENEKKYEKTNVLATYQVAIYNKKEGMSEHDAIKHTDSCTGLDIVLPVEGESEFSIYEVIYDKQSQLYTSVRQIEYTLSDDKKFATVTVANLTDTRWIKEDITRRLYSAVDKDYQYTGVVSGTEEHYAQFYAVVTEGTTEKPSVDNTEFTYDGTAKTLEIPESNHYTVSGDVSETLNGNYKTTVTLNNGYVWADGSSDPLTFEWRINALKATKPTAVSGLKYNGKKQTGVNSGTGYILTGTYQATNVGSYKATVLLADGYEWADGSSDPLSLNWKIAKGTQKITAKTGSKSYKLADLKKKKASFTIGAKAAGTVSYKVQSAPSKNAKKYISVSKQGVVTMKKGAPAGTYKVRVSAAATSKYNAATKDIKITVKKANQTITSKASSKTYKVSDLKKKKATFTIGAEAKGALSYKVTSTPKNAEKYISVSKKGEVTMKKGAPKGTYKITVTAKATSAYNSTTKVIKIVVK